MTLPLCSDAVSIGMVTGAARLISFDSSFPGRMARTRNERAKKPTPAPKAITCAWLSQAVGMSSCEAAGAPSNATLISVASRLVTGVMACDDLGPVTRETQKRTKPARMGSPESVRTSQQLPTAPTEPTLGAPPRQTYAPT